MSPTLRLGTRRSDLARTQSGWVADLLRDAGHQVDLVTIVTEGDVSPAPLTQIGGTGVFATAIRRALHAGQVDLAVHSFKDLPSAPEPGLVVAAVPAREDPRDALVAREGLTLATLPEGARIGTGSPRRAAQLLVFRPDLTVVPIRGNVPTRVAQVTAGALDAVVLARAGLARLGLLDAVTEVLDLADMLPAAGQGALAVECRADRTDVLAAVAPLMDPAADAAVRAERSLLATLEGGCTAPIGAHARIVQTPAGINLQLSAFVGTSTGNEHLRRASVGSPLDPEGLGADLARRLLDEGAGRFTSA